MQISLIAVSRAPLVKLYTTDFSFSLSEQMKPDELVARERMAERRQASDSAQQR